MNDESRGDRRAETAREHDDSQITEQATEAPGQQGRHGGNLQRDVGTHVAKERVRDPEATEGPRKAFKIAHGQDVDNQSGGGAA